MTVQFPEQEYVLRVDLSNRRVLVFPDLGYWILARADSESCRVLWRLNNFYNSQANLLLKRWVYQGEHGVIYTLTNQGKFTCHLYGHLGVIFYDNKGRILPFKYTWSKTQYVKNAAPHMVVLNVGESAYFLVANYRCDLGIAMKSTTIRVYPPNTKSQLVGRSAPSSVGGFAYCKGGINDPGQLVSVSPVAATPFSLF